LIYATITVLQTFVSHQEVPRATLMLQRADSTKMVQKHCCQANKSRLQQHMKKKTT